jgi:hypothetical protein
VTSDRPGHPNPSHNPQQANKNRTPPKQGAVQKQPRDWLAEILYRCGCLTISGALAYAVIRVIW